MPKKIVIYWRDIPSQVIFKKGRKTGKAQLSHRFQEAVDRAAMRAGKGSSDAYIAEWRRVTSQVSDVADLQTAAAEAAGVIESQFTDEDLTRLIKQNGSAEPE